jgi:antirestriction protein ArdC
MNAADLTPRIQQFVQDLAAETDAVRASQMFTSYLDAMARFHDYSANNQILIYFQNPNAQQVAGYTTWQKLGRQVRKGEKGMAILAPVVVKMDQEGVEVRRVVNFRVVYVFDVSQTDGEPLPPAPDWAGTERQSELHARLIVFAESQGIAVSTGNLPHGARGASTGGTIILTRDASTKTLIHEIAHELLHRSFERATLDRQTKEIEAETVAYVVARHFNLAELKSPNYLALWGADAKAIQSRLARIQQAAGQIIAAVDEAAAMEVER